MTPRFLRETSTQLQGMMTKAMERWKGAGLLALWVALAITPLSAQEGLTREVQVGIFVNQIRNLSLQENRFDADFYLWFRWRPEEWIGTADGKWPYQTFELVGAAALDTDLVDLRPGYAVLRVTTTLSEYWDVRNFPRDDHVIRFRVEDSATEIDKLVLVPDRQNSAVHQDIRVPGWHLQPIRIIADTSRYESNFGDTTVTTGARSDYARVGFLLPLQREGVGMVWKMFGGLFVAVCVALLAFFVDAREVDPRFGLGVGALFAGVANQYIVSENLPPGGSWTLSDKVHFLAFLVILFVLTSGAVALSLLRRGGPRTEQFVYTMDRIAFGTIAITWVTLTIFLIRSAGG